MTRPPNASVGFFDRQFRRQIEAREYALNPFEARALPYLRGEVLDLGCGLGNLALAAAKQGARVTALDASAAAVADLARRSREEGVEIAAEALDLGDWRPRRQWDAVACIGLLMFVAPEAARAALATLRAAVRPGGVAVVNVLVEGTTYFGMFDPVDRWLPAPGELAGAFEGWRIVAESRDDFPAPGGTVKRFETVIAERPRAAGPATRRS